jgi:large subunit ribosomal protein L21
MYAILETGNEQFRVEEGETLTIPKIEAKAGDTWTFDRVLLVNDGQEARVGAPHLEGATVTAEVLGDSLGKKVTIFKMKRRATYRLKRGHRQQYTDVRIDKINLPG